jgi:HlyD family secretion protein
MKIKKSWVIIALVVIIIIAWFVARALLKNPIEGYITENVVLGDVVQEISETGSVKATQDLGLGFKVVGRISRVNVAIGDTVKKGDVLAELDSSQIAAQLQSARAALNYTTNQYTGGVAAAKDNLQSAYNSAINTLNDAYTKTYNAYSAVVSVQRDYFLMLDQSGIKVAGAKDDINQNAQDMKEYLDNTKTNSGIDAAISKSLINLDNVLNDLTIVRDQCDMGSYYYSVSSTDKAAIDTQKTYINTAKTSITTAQSTINSYKIALQRAEDLTSNSGSTEDVMGSQVEQAQANVDALQSQLSDNYLRSPIDGIITQVNIKRGQTISLSQPVINLLSTEPFQIKVDIYEQDIVNVKVGQDVKIDLVAFPKQTFKGKVLSIDPAETIVDNVIYYKVTIEFPNQPEGVKSGMTADIVVEANKKENVLRVPKNGVENIDGKEFVQIIKDKKIENREIVTGLEGNDYYEVISGLQSGDVIVTGKQ